MQKKAIVLWRKFGRGRRAKTMEELVEEAKDRAMQEAFEHVMEIDMKLAIEEAQEHKGNN
jgi:hypothetical protein